MLLSVNRTLLIIALVMFALFTDSCKKKNDDTSLNEVLIDSLFIFGNYNYFIDIDKNGIHDVCFVNAGHTGHFFADFVSSYKILNNNFQVHTVTITDTYCLDTTYYTATSPPGIDTTITCHDCLENEVPEIISSPHITAKLFASKYHISGVLFNPNVSDSVVVKFYSNSSYPPYPMPGIHWKCTEGNRNFSSNYILFKRNDGKKWAMRIDYSSSRIYIYDPKGGV